MSSFFLVTGIILFSPVGLLVFLLPIWLSVISKSSSWLTASSLFDVRAVAKSCPIVFSSPSVKLPLVHPTLGAKFVHTLLGRGFVSFPQTLITRSSPILK